MFIFIIIIKIFTEKIRVGDSSSHNNTVATQLHVAPIPNLQKIAFLHISFKSIIIILFVIIIFIIIAKEPDFHLVIRFLLLAKG